MSSRFDSENFLVESKYIKGADVYDSSIKKHRNLTLDEDINELKQAGRNSENIFKSLEKDVANTESTNRGENRRKFDNKRNNIASKYKNLDLERIQEKVRLNSRTDGDMVGSTTRYLETRNNLKAYNTGETSSIDSKDELDYASNSSMALSYGNLENNLDKFNDKLHDLEKKLNNIELSRT